MEQRTIGSLSVSVVGMGCNQLGTKACDETASLQVVGEALDNGITLFDTSDEYGRDYANPADLSGWGRPGEAADAADELGVRPFASSQNLLNLLVRRALDDSLAASAELGLAFLPYYPLASGVLTGKYQRGQASPAGARLTDQVSDDVRAK